jgi:hypothetical protein
MKKCITLLILFSVQFLFSCNCLSYNEAQKKSINENKFILLHYTSSMRMDDKGNGIFYLRNLTDEENKIAENFVYLCISFGNIKWNQFDKYQLNKKEAIVLLDANGEIIYRTEDLKDGEKVYLMLKNFSKTPTVLNSILKNYIKKPTYSSSLRISQYYYDYSMLFEQEYRKSILDLGLNYINKAEELATKKDKDNESYNQKIKLFKLFRFAFNQNFDVLFERINEIDEATVNSENTTIYYFLKFLGAKAMQSDDLVKLEEKTKSIEGFDYYINKANLILNQKDLVIN